MSTIARSGGGLLPIVALTIGCLQAPSEHTDTEHMETERAEDGASERVLLASDGFPLLGSSHGGLATWDFCEGKSDSTPLPIDPRTLVQPGVSDGRAVHFNAFWRDCHVDPEAVQEEGAAVSCGELRARYEAGARLMETGSEGPAAMFVGDDATTASSAFGIATFSAQQYENLWRSWGYPRRPDNFDELVAQRYGSVFKEGRNPYPLAGEDPNRTDGGSGQLPEMLTQLRDKKGRWSGRIGLTCHVCHSGGAGDIVTYGGGNSLADFNLLFRDMAERAWPLSVVTILNLSQVRGTTNASDINLAFALPDEGALPIPELLGIIGSGSTAGMNPPAWWNMGHRAVKFVDGVFPMDAPRVDVVFFTPLFGLFGSAGGQLSEAGQDWMRAHGPAVNTWVETLKAPAYPLPIDTALAEQGAILFHVLDLWGKDRNNPVPRPEGNGSCAGCHGAYSPRFANDPAYLATPELEGMASYIVPLDIIGTDAARVKTNNEAVQRAGARNFFGYPSTQGTENDCGPQNQKRLRGDRKQGYLAPPLYGVWASAPYFHNGSVPNVWEVLKPAERKPIWRRASVPNERGDELAVMGFDTDLDRAYDPDKLGWKYDTIDCEWRGAFNPAVTPYMSCNPKDEYKDPFAQQVMEGLYSNLILTWNLLSPLPNTKEQLEDRKIYNTHLYAQGNEGHEFTAVLRDHEVRAIVEYLKTL